MLALPLALATGVWWFARQDQRTAADALVVLGAAQFDGRPSAIFEARLRHAQSLYLDGVAPVVVTVGGSQPGDRLTEAGAGEAWLVDHAVPSSDVVAVPTGSNTLRSMEAVAAEAAARGWGTVVVVTDPWHALRAHDMAEAAGMDAESSPTRQGPSVRDRSTQLRYIARETAAYAYWRLLGESAEAGPRAV